ncbi:uncharacterized protein LOC142350913 isoform X2 [Convolutriloba macropyga]|uniref:uncharacterized protein LOC142350913 isoform X2 n=1 Tax=Convolutriloba macropyga TaxID=536237 RepID=UPI003F51DED4
MAFSSLCCVNSSQTDEGIDFKKTCFSNSQERLCPYSPVVNHRSLREYNITNNPLQRENRISNSSFGHTVPNVLNVPNSVDGVPRLRSYSSSSGSCPQESRILFSDYREVAANGFILGIQSSADSDFHRQSRYGDWDSPNSDDFICTNFQSIRLQYGQMLDRQLQQTGGATGSQYPSGVASDAKSYMFSNRGFCQEDNVSNHMKRSDGSAIGQQDKRSMLASYEFSPELRNVAQNRILHSLGLSSVDLKTAHQSAIVIQRAYRNYRIKRYFEQCYMQRRKQSCDLLSAKGTTLNSSGQECPKAPKRNQSSKLPPPTPPRKSSESRLSAMQRNSSASRFLANVPVNQSDIYEPKNENVANDKTLTNAAKSEMSKYGAKHNDDIMNLFDLSNLSMTSKQINIDENNSTHSTSNSSASQNTTPCSEQLTNYMNIDDYISSTGAYVRSTNRNSTYSEHTSSGSDEGTDPNAFSYADQCESNYNCNSQFLYSSSNLNIDQHSQQFQISPNLLSSHGSHNEATSINPTNATNQLGNDRLITSSLQAAPSGSITNRANNSSAIGPLSPQLGKSHNSGQSANTSSLLLSANHNSAINSDARLPQTANYTNVNGSLTSGNNSVNFNQGLLTGSVSKQEKLPSCYNSSSLLRSTNPNVINSYPVPGNLSNVSSASNAMGIQNQQQPIGSSGLCSPNVNASLVKQNNNAVASIGGQSPIVHSNRERSSHSQSSANNTAVDAGQSNSLARRSPATPIRTLKHNHAGGSQLSMVSCDSSSSHQQHPFGVLQNSSVASTASLIKSQQQHTLQSVNSQGYPPRHPGGMGNNGPVGSRARHFLNENLAQLRNCKMVGFKYTPQQELTIRVGLFLFNKDPKRGIKFLTDRGFLDRDCPDDIAYMFACYKRGLNKTQVGEYLGSDKAFNCLVLKSFVELNRPRFQGKQIDDALRSFLPIFRLPGESQKIDRILMHFGHVYALMNEQIALMLGGPQGSELHLSHEERVAKGASAAHVLAYAVMILNTDLHNSNVQCSMSLKDFKKNCRRSDELRHLDDSFLEGIYKRIKTNKFAQPEDNSTAVALFSKNLKNFDRNMILDEPFRSLIAVCPFNYVPDPRNLKDTTELHLFLFNDLLLAASKDSNKKKPSSKTIGGSSSSGGPTSDLLSVLAQNFTYKFDIPLLSLQIDSFDLNSQRQMMNAAGSGSGKNALQPQWGITLSSRDFLGGSSSTNSNNGINRAKSTYTFLCSNQDDLLKFTNDIRTQTRDMTVIDQLRVQDNFELMQNRGAGFAGPDSEMIDGRGYRDDGSRSGSQSRQKDLSLTRQHTGELLNGRGLERPSKEFKNSRNKSNSIDSLLDPPMHHNGADRGSNFGPNADDLYTQQCKTVNAKHTYHHHTDEAIATPKNTAKKTVDSNVPIFPAIHQTSFSDDLMFVNIEDIPHKMRHNNNSASDEDDDDDNVTLYNGSWDYKSVPTVPLSPSTASTTNVLHAKSNSVSGAITSAKPRPTSPDSQPLTPPPTEPRGRTRSPLSILANHLSTPKSSTNLKSFPSLLRLSSSKGQARSRSSLTSTSSLTSKNSFDSKVKRNSTAVSEKVSSPFFSRRRNSLQPQDSQKSEDISFERRFLSTNSTESEPGNYESISRDLEGSFEVRDESLYSEAQITTFETVLESSSESCGDNLTTPTQEIFDELHLLGLKYEKEQQFSKSLECKFLNSEEFFETAKRQYLNSLIYENHSKMS